jgi:AraC-like DNA-binding protein
MSRASSDTATRLPAPVLRPFIAHYAGFCIAGLPPGTFMGLPSRNIGLIISFIEPIDILHMPNRDQRPGAYGALVAGLQDAPVLVRQYPDAHGLHVFFTPLGARSILGVPSVELASRIVALGDLWGRDAAALIERLVSARTWEERFKILDQAFIAKLTPTQAVPEIAAAWQELLRTHGTRRIGELARAAGWSRRHFAERFRDSLGITPKVAARVFRFERACWLMRRRVALADVAAASGYYDQAHLTREWRALAGCAPQAWIAAQLPFLQDYELAGGDPAA